MKRLENGLRIGVGRALGSLSVFATLFPLLVACSADGGDDKSAATGQDAAPAVEEPEDAGPPATTKCGVLTQKSKCKREGSIVRGIARFGASHFKPGAKPVLRVVLRHSFVVETGEEAIGGRLHAWKSIEIADPSAGEVPFAIDMCEGGTSMWSEENGSFNVVLIVDENGNNDLETAGTRSAAVKAATPDATELVKIVPVDVSCSATSPCLDVSIDCTGGTKCTTITPITSCKKKTPGCASDSAFCR